jgi:cation:H+ antiporter
MSILHQLIILGLLFYALSRVADIIIVRVRRVSQHLGLSIALIGILLGILTTLPEIAIAFNALGSGAAEISLGNLFGGIPVMLGLILGVSLIFNRGIDTSKSQVIVPLLVAFIALPFILALDGKLGTIDGMVIIALYVAYLAWIYFKNGAGSYISVEIVSKKRITHDILEIIAAAIAVVLFSDLIMEFTLNFMEQVSMPQFLIGLFVFAIGTNLPEIAVTFRSWRQKVSELSLSHIFGSAATNVLVIGFIGFRSPTAMPIGYQYWTYVALVLALLVCLVIFTRTDKRLSAREGIVVIGLFAAAMLSQALFAVYG